MNIFALDSDPVLAAKYHCDKHVVKMILETVQLLSNCVYYPPRQGNTQTYRHSHLKHPCTIWVFESKLNFEWLYELGMELSAEYQRRYQKIHKSAEVIRRVKSFVAPNFWANTTGMTPFKQVMPDQYKVPGDPIAAYRNYYIGDKVRFATWKCSTPPVWWPYSI